MTPLLQKKSQPYYNEYRLHYLAKSAARTATAIENPSMAIGHQPKQSN